MAAPPQHRRLLLWLLLLLAASGVAPSPALAVREAGPAVPSAEDARREIVVGAADDSYPYSYAGDGAAIEGFGVDLLDAVARTMSLPVRRVVAPSKEIQERFRSGDFDMLQALSQTHLRESYTQFSVPYLTLQGAIFVHKGGSIRSPADFAGRKFAVGGTDSIVEQYFRERGIPIKPVFVSSTIEALRLVDSGECAGAFASQLTALSVIQRAGLQQLHMLDEPLPGYDIRHCFAVHPGNAQLLARLNEGLAILHRTGEFDRIHNKWFGQFTSSVVSREQVITWSALAFAVAFALALGGYLNQRQLRERIAGQTAQLAAHQGQLQALYDNIPMAIAVLEAAPEGCRVLSINRGAETWFGRPAAETEGRLLADLPVHREWLVQLTELLPRGLAGGAQLREERRLEAARKRLIFSLVPMSPGPGGTARVCALVEDITERRNLDEEIAQSRKLRAVGELVGGIAHEFNNLLTPIMLKVGEIQLAWGHDPQLLAETRLIAEAVQRSAELTRRLLTFGRKTDAGLELVHLGTLINTCFSLLRLTVERRIHWEQDVPANLPPIYFSPTDLNQIILNLVINARDTLLDKLAQRRGEWTPYIRVEVRLLPAGSIAHADGTPTQRQVLGWQRLTVRDNGLGMTPEVRERIFEPFFTTKDVGKGTGLGLATVWHLVTEVSGRIEVESTPGEGTAFHVYLPMLPPPASAARATPAVAPPGSGRARILLAEDDDLVAGAIVPALQKSGHEVTRFADGAQAWQHLQGQLHGYDLLIFDVNMPGLDGIELAQRVRTTCGYTGPIMITSGRLGSDDLRQLAESRVDAVLNKPFSIAELIDAVRRCLTGGARK